MTLYDLYNGSLNLYYNGSLLAAVASTYESAFYGYWPYFIIFGVVMILVYIRNRNLGVLGVCAGALGEALILLGKFPAYFHIAAYLTMAFSAGLSLYLFFTEKDTGP